MSSLECDKVITKIGCDRKIPLISKLDRGETQELRQFQVSSSRDILRNQREKGEKSLQCSKERYGTRKYSFASLVL